ncbi:Hypothetical_protein [Hexamita inflata]|uniref:Hypothetical_protein n=1 Tax=Hexamita inflata TaxID=28002 RepID=A0AA86TS28_9EUKA|nr:Hypothetical protein HINF_LOCUS13905 [Hexamita inflata]
MFGGQLGEVISVVVDHNGTRITNGLNNQPLAPDALSRVFSSLPPELSHILRAQQARAHTQAQRNIPNQQSAQQPQEQHQTQNQPRRRQILPAEQIQEPEKQNQTFKASPKQSMTQLVAEYEQFDVTRELKLLKYTIPNKSNFLNHKFKYHLSIVLYFYVITSFFYVVWIHISFLFMYLHQLWSGTIKEQMRYYYNLIHVIMTFISQIYSFILYYIRYFNNINQYARYMLLFIGRYKLNLDYSSFFMKVKIFVQMAYIVYMINMIILFLSLSLVARYMQEIY